MTRLDRTRLDRTQRLAFGLAVALLAFAAFANVFGL